MKVKVKVKISQSPIKQYWNTLIPLINKAKAKGLNYIKIEDMPQIEGYYNDGFGLIDQLDKIAKSKGFKTDLGLDFWADDCIWGIISW